MKQGTVNFVIFRTQKQRIGVLQYQMKLLKLVWKIWVLMTRDPEESQKIAEV